ncbi:MAG TPA: redoxin domain-containing protein [Planctomycetaceae bacterium]|jgi:peroxiredoxin|nr:redoxin domain-containing protein [Planctomycetaceae bacterium]
MSSLRASSLVLALLLTATADGASGNAPLGKRIEPFALKDVLGTTRSLDDWKDRKAVVVVFLGTDCPLARLYGPKLSQLARAYQGKQVQFVGIDANQQDSLAQIGHYVRTAKIEFPVLKDLGNKVADRFGAVRTPEVFLLDQSRVVRYRGPIDDQFGVGVARGKAVHNYLEDALDAVLGGKPVATAFEEPVGCRIGRINQRPAKGDVTYSNQVARILQARCVGCHQAGEIAPFSLTSYGDAVGWAETIREVVRDQRMPPWFANPQYGKFQNDCRLTDDEKRLLNEWIDNGVPEGGPALLPKQTRFAEGWRIPKPDFIVKMPQPYKVVAKGVIEYQYFIVDPGFKHDVWVRAAENRPGNRSVVHHMALFYMPPGQIELEPADLLFRTVAAFTPGTPPLMPPDGIARRVPAGSKLVFQMHYTPNGTEQLDQSEVALVFADPQKVKKELSMGVVVNFKLEVPPNEPNYHVDAAESFDEDTLVYAFLPHMHLRGKSFRFTAAYPDGHKEVLLDVPRYDFNWQNVYWLAQPKLLPAGARLECAATYDNSENNLANPDPTRTVHWGDQTSDEMFVGSYYSVPAEQDLSLGSPPVARLGNHRYEAVFKYRPTHPAKTVHLAGTFNDWNQKSLPMTGPDREGAFTTKLELPEGYHEYKFLVDGHVWKTDPGNGTHTDSEHNSVLAVGALTPPSIAQSAGGTYKVLFCYRPATVAKEIYLSGSFNKWNPTGQKMSGPDSDGYYKAAVKLPEGRHEYKFVLDGKVWKSDPSNPIQNGPTHNSVLALKP